jgi:hypothetical protein
VWYTLNDHDKSCNTTTVVLFLICEKDSWELIGTLDIHSVFG